MENRYKGLDGWRGISIIFVIAGHWLPLGIKDWQLNSAVAATGMAVFFILSGFLITSLLLRDSNIVNFLIRRFVRIVPLAWLVLCLVLFFNNASVHQWLSSLLFYANWPPMGFMEGTEHFWSLCLEVQFYLSIALLVILLKKKAFWCLPLLCLTITAYRYANDVEMAINTYYRADEILSGCCLALVYKGNNFRLKGQIGKLYTPSLLILLIISAHPISGALNYLRPYIAFLLVGSTLFSVKVNWWNTYLDSKFLSYVAGISYALYVIHGALDSTWLGSGNTLEKYAKRPILFVLSLILAHISSKYFESYWINFGKRVTNKKTRSLRNLL